MAERTSPTEWQRRLGSEIRKMRTAAGLSAEATARLLGVDRSRLSNIEQGLRAISQERVRTLAQACNCSNEKFVEALVSMAAPTQRGWWNRYRDTLPAGLLDISEIEAHALRMRTAHSVHIPGVLQTSDHALAVFRVVVPALPEHEVALRLAHRMERQQMLDGSTPQQYVGIVHEAALRMQFGGRKVARQQLEHLLSVSARPHITLRVIPFEAGAFPGAGQTVNYAEGPVAGLDTVQVDSAHGPEFLYEEDQLAKYRAHLDWMERIALTPARSRDFIHTAAHSL
ncbi:MULTISPECIES: helix-turn-helix domain-containing protein [Streptomyces]|uniref:Transcriptional regulator with XRE-family HTH domain n=1 Tax=Streptomyces clavifer TaxID=68188 RepID=A0ABS4V626_9ACTN|nr:MULTISPECIES: helix-turn-helix transcriptional regulator [Streptomyces]MBP2359367.1 transcriptional regulator with XRE-family HTH domain [Streptomyces clavifer]MDX2744853.1 helix-turn-helix transcriptional regulator [Streptomyces sp. NRRL_B-2557]RPK80611.1 Helix-turn-helix protein [Streptomyces sp. ADI97-07]GHA80862.1 transcriptional regulator [Streptomyces clavifer]